MAKKTVKKQNQLITTIKKDPALFLLFVLAVVGFSISVFDNATATGYTTLNTKEELLTATNTIILNVLALGVIVTLILWNPNQSVNKTKTTRR